MKQFWLMIMCCVGSMALLAGCQNDVPAPTPDAPQLNIEQTTVDVSADGGHFTIGYELLNPVDGAEVKVNAEHSWVHNIEITPDAITFDVAVSYETNERSCRLEIIYPGIYPNPTIKVKQSVGKEHSIKLELVSAAATTITMNVTPKDKNMPYVFILGNGNYLLGDNGKLMYDDEALWASDLEIFQSFADAFDGEASLAALAFMYDGDLHPHQFTGVTPNTTYVAYAYGFDNETLTPLTEISRLVIKTAEVNDYTLHFDFNVQVNGPNVSIDVTPKGYDGYFYYGVFWAKDVPKGTAPDVLRSLCESDWEQQKGLYASFFDTPEEGLHFVFSELAYKGTAHIDAELDANTEFVLWAFGMNDEALLNTTPETYYFTTGNVTASENSFTLSVEELHPRKATVKVATTNDDPYIATLVSAEKFANNTNEDIIQYIIDNFRLSYVNGTMSDTATGLLPSTEYELLVFGCQAGAPTTGLSRLKFTTPDVIYADLDFSLEIGDYYDGAAVAQLNSSYAGFDGSVIVNITANVDPDAVNFYFTAVDALDYPYYGYEQLIEGLVASGKADVQATYAFEFDTAYTFFGAAEDINGNFTKIWESKETTFTKAGCSPAEEFFMNTSKVQSMVINEDAATSKMLSIE